MKKRPTSVTVIAWFLIVMGGISLVSSTLTINNPMVRDIMSKSPIPIPIQFGMLYAGIIVTLISGIFFLRGKAWARILYVAWSAIGFIVGVTTSPMKAAMIPGFVVFLVISFFLFRPGASAFFSQATSVDDSQSV